MAGGQANAFALLPIEINQLIATNFDRDQDIGNYRMICRTTLDSIDADGCSFWRRRFQAIFESPSWKLTGQRLRDNEKFRDQYKMRKDMLKNGAVFKRFSSSKRQRGCLEVLRDLIVDCFADKAQGDGTNYESPNLKVILRFVESNDLLNNIGCHFGNKPRDRSKAVSVAEPLLYTVQCLLAPVLFSFNPHTVNSHYGFAEAQQIVYGTNISHPIFIGCNGLDVNMPWVLANIQFWRHHLLRKDEGILRPAFEALDPADRPRWFSSQLSQKMRSLGSEWKGCYAFVDRHVIKDIRAGVGLNDHIIDELNGESTGDVFQNLALSLLDPATAKWPNIFEKHLHSLTPPVSKARTRAQKRAGSPDAIKDLPSQSFRFDGEGRDVDEEFCASGWLNPLPLQSGVPGWQRMTMMKYFIDEVTNVIDHDALWAYEGVVLPGAQIMLGRWWCPSDGSNEDMYSGPFILWCVDKESGKVGEGDGELEEAAEKILFE